MPARTKTPDQRAAIPDSRLVAQCLRGDQSAWSGLIHKYKNLIYSIPIKYGFPQEEAADIFQAVCIELVRELENLREPNALPGWLVRVTHSKCFHRKRERSRFVAEEFLPEPAVPSEQVPETFLRQIEEEQLIRSAVRELAPRCRELVMKLFFDVPARPNRQLARELGLALGSIGFIRQRCLEKLRQKLETTGVRP